MTVTDIFAQRLRVAMAVADVRSAALADHLGVSRAAVTRWTQGTAFPRSSHLVATAQFLNCGVDWLMFPEPIQTRTEYDRPSHGEPSDV